MKFKIILVLALAFFSAIANATDISANYKTFFISQKQLEHIIVELRHCNFNDDCLQEMKSALYTDFVWEPSCREALTPSDGLIDIIVPFSSSLCCALSGFLLGDLDVSMPDNLIALKVACSVVIWLVGALLYCHVPINHKKEMAQYRERQIPFNLEVFIERLNKLTINGVNVLQINKELENYTIKIESTIIEQLKQLDFCSKIFSKDQIF